MLRLWLPPKVWLQGSQSTQHRLLVLQEAPDLRDHLLVGAQHAVGVDHHLGVAGGARGEQVLGVGVGRDGLRRPPSPPGSRRCGPGCRSSARREAPRRRWLNTATRMQPRCWPAPGRRPGRRTRRPAPAPACSGCRGSWCSPASAGSRRWTRCTPARPMCMPASSSSRWSTALSDSTTIGACGASFSPSRLCAMRPTCARVWRPGQAAPVAAAACARQRPARRASRPAQRSSHSPMQRA